MTDSDPPPSPWIIVATRERFQQDVVDRSFQQPVVVDFWAPWCQPCRLLAPVLEKLAAEAEGKFLLVKANTEELPEAAAQFGVQSIPAVYALRDGQVRDMFIGLLPEPQIRDWLQRLLPSPAELLASQADRLAALDPASAEDHFRQAIELDGQLAAARIGLAHLLLAQDRLAECRQQIEQLQRRGFLEPEAERIRAAVALRAQGGQAGNLDACRAQAAQNPADLQLQLRLAEALAASEQYAEALETGLKIVQADRHGLGERARQLMVDIFRLLPEGAELTSTYRRKLSSALY